VTAEIEALHASFTEFLENHLPQLIESTADDLSASILKTLNRTWLAQDRADRHDIRGFQRRLLKHWGRAIDRLRMALAIAREFGEGASAALRNNPTPGTIISWRSCPGCMRVPARSLMK
jgi:hypothetical protein